MSRLFLARHGETIWHAENRYAGSTNIALTPRGHEQAVALAAWAAAAGLTHLYASSLQRAIDTATPVAQATRLELRVEPRLVELDFGKAEGRTAAELRSDFPEAFRNFERDAAAHHLPGGEAPSAAVARARTALEDIASSCGPDARVLIVAHNTLIRLLISDVLGIPLGRYRTLFPVLRNTALTEVEYRGGAEPASLLSFNVPAQGHFLR